MRWPSPEARERQWRRWWAWHPVTLDRLPKIPGSDDLQAGSDIVVWLEVIYRKKNWFLSREDYVAWRMNWEKPTNLQ